ncbi:filamentous hemagglutinin N-terminal domain-containing protein [Ralstonia pseudosolanacearum]|uniref:filamentous hemagglutinin N-terminal domain-containing protein n=1 Tax=Ralstonia pseudosolanacearum TaxID=1310165 RepID=UPI00270F038B|nr:filamentous hemagglutinin N-terminal domain-containing protein [Ralstonia pseudosolanacearum]MDO3617324.1 filamentous hemagglutinin N-terminal domain-containing protein [Ralstonia pseudosolanacearum]
MHSPHSPARLAALLGLCAVFMPPIAVAAGIVADGGTTTTVSTGANGRQLVNLAPSVAGVSHNTYTSFNVGTAGADLNNTTVAARTIVNQVTSTNPSLIQGNIAVLGPRANVILANPNGITVDGGSFTNTGNVALTTGQVSFNDFTTGSGSLQRNVVLNTSSGAINIGPGGLAGTMLNLELIAKQVRVAGAVQNSFTDPNSTVRIVAGNSRAEVDTSVSPTDNLSSWVSYSTTGTGTPLGLAIDIASGGSLTGGRIELLVTDQGAGVRHAGAAFATAGDFVVRSTGDLQLASGTIQAANDVLIGSAGLTGNGAVSANRNQQISSGKVHLDGATLAAGTASQTGSIVIGASGQIHTEPVTVDHSTLTATGGVGLFDAGPGVSMTATQLTATQNVVAQVASLSLGADASGSSQWTSRQGTVAITSPGAVQVAGSRIDGVGGTTVQAASISLSAANGTAATVQSSGGDVALNASGAYTQTDASIIAAGNATLHGGSVGITASALPTSVAAVGGGVLIQSDADLTNTGGLIQGKTRNTAQSAAEGAVTLVAGGNLRNDASASTQGIVFGQDDDVVLRAGGDLINRQSRILSNARLTLAAQGDVLNTLDKTPGANGEQPNVWSSSGTRWLFLRNHSTGFDIDYGSIAQTGQVPYLVSQTGTAISGRNVRNVGGQILANGIADIAITAANVFHNEALPTGQAHFSRSCMIFCRSNASSTVSTTGGAISAGGNLSIQAGTLAENIGGQVLSVGNLTVTAPKVRAAGITGYTALARDRGFKAFFGDTWARLYAADVGGNWLAMGGALTINGQGQIEGGSFDGQTVTASNGIVTVRARSRQPVAIDSHVGLTSWLWQ